MTETSAVTTGQVVPLQPKLKTRRAHKQAKPQLLTRDRIDRRSNAYKLFHRRLAAIESDLGGAESLSTIQRSMAEGYTGAVVLLENIITRTLLGETVDPLAYCAIVTAMTRLASRLGVRRIKAKADEPSLADYLAARPSAARVIDASADEPAPEEAA
jgi:hypothetical protein